MQMHLLKLIITHSQKPKVDNNVFPLPMCVYMLLFGMIFDHFPNTYNLLKTHYSLLQQKPIPHGFKGCFWIGGLV